MDRRSWPWKKKSSEKATTTTDSTSTSSSNPTGNQADQESTKSVNYVQVSAEKYAHLTDLEDQVKVLNEKLSSAQSEITTKENLVKQHTKVAEEAVSGWEKAEAEASALKVQLESVTLLKLTAEQRASHLDGALKECMKQIRNVKEESEQKLHDVVFSKTKHWEKIKAELEAKIVDFEQELLKASAENTAVSRSLQERSAMLMKISDEKSQADAEIEVLKNNLQLCEREISSLKYELHVVSKELEIRNEEKNMSIRSADVANKQHLEDVKKISKLEAECQRLRGLVRKKLPGPAALAQMKLEVENLGRDYGDTRLRRSPAKNSSLHHISTPVSDLAFEHIQQFQKENEFLTARLLATEEETKMLKEALSKRNSELQASRNMCARTASKLRSFEVHLLAPNQQMSPSKSNSFTPFNGILSQHESNPPSLTSMSEDGIDEEGSCSESWATALMLELSQFKKENNVDKSKKADNSNRLEIMDDFLEMERLACVSSETNGTVTISDSVVDRMKIENVEATSTADIQKNGGGEGLQRALVPPRNLVYTGKEQSDGECVSSKFASPLSELQSRIASLFESGAQDTDMSKLLEGIRCIVQDVQQELPQHSGCVIKETYSADATCDQNEAMGETTDGVISSKQDHNSCCDAKHVMDPGLKNAISQIHDFVVSLGKEAIEIQGRTSEDRGINERIEQFSASVNKVVCNEISLIDFILALSKILSETSFNMSSDKRNEGESNSSDCIDKVTLLENKEVEHESAKENFSGVRLLVPHSSSDPEIEGPVGHDFEVKATLQKFSLEEFEHLKLEKENMEMELARCNEMLEYTKSQLVETEQNLAELKSQLAASQKSNSLSETQLKCMAESYKTLESRTKELEAEIVLLLTKAESLDNELQEERRSHQDDLAKYKDLQEQIERNEKSLMCSDADNDIKTKQEKEIAAAAEKLAECQETIRLLGRQLQTMRPPAESSTSSPNNRHRMSDYLLENEPGPSGFNRQTLPHLSHSEMENAAVPMTHTTGSESPLDGYNSHMSPPDTEASSFPRSPISSKRQKHRSSRASSSTSFPNTMPEKQGRGFSRFFSKGRSDH
ncbi:filament-like plant protein 4 [Elaeis guineensis]|uniref:Filament-like plant protein 4 n=1 Tax=Elaeis guineensis var. tenera TaxID=51953 RepID=A0A6I9QZK0_ELAGV|nr:filament-like plant protein 4 [Elaeis guineensis]XP_010917981.1 filament-like plant protein 4 [Elaeis guineensis]